MKAFSLIFISTLLVFSEAFGQHSAKTTMHGDTVINFRMDTSKTKNKLSNKYTPDPEAVKSFKDHFVKNMVSPGNTNHALYKAYISKGAALIPQVKIKLSERVKEDPSVLTFTKVHSASELTSCKIEMLPVYYLTHNVVSYTDDKKFSDYFNLDTAIQYYCLTKNNAPVGLIYYVGNRVRFKVFSTGDSLSYQQIASLRKQPVGFILSIYDAANLSNVRIDCFGYFNGREVIFALCQQGVYTMKERGKPDKRVINKTCELKSADSFYIGSDSTSSPLPQFINGANKFLKLQQKNNTKKQ